MKYITTDKHPELKEGITLHETSQGDYLSFLGFAKFSKVQIDHQLGVSHIKEVEEKEFTKSDCADLLKHYWIGHGYDVEKCNSFIDEWQKQR